jgi:hypothetical protein
MMPLSPFPENSENVFSSGRYSLIFICGRKDETQRERKERYSSDGL